MDVQWRDVSVTVPFYGSDRTILHTTSGHLPAARMRAVMGPSGSGKTTFLSCLRQVIRHEGEVRYDGSYFDPRLRQLIGLVEQVDQTFPTLSVRENLQFLTELRFGIGSKQSYDKLDEVLQITRLGHCLDVLCSEISGGELKRMCIARELVREPTFLIGDEPTTGLDSFMAYSVIDAFKTLCLSGKMSTICAIHQPSTTLLEKFDDIILLREGRFLFQGPVAEVEAFFMLHGPSKHPSESVAEYLIDCTALNEDEPGGMSPEMIEHCYGLVQAQAASLPPLPPPKAITEFRARFDGIMTRELYCLGKRWGKTYWVEVYTAANVIAQIADVAISGAVFWQLSYRYVDAKQRIAAVNWGVGHWVMSAIFTGIRALEDDFEITSKELQMGAYSVTSYYICRIWFNFVLDASFPVCWSAVYFWMANLSPYMNVYFYFLAAVLFSYMLFQSIGLCISAMHLPLPLAMLFGMFMISFSIGWSGFFADLHRLPAVLQWPRHLNGLQYVANLIAHVIFYPEEKPEGFEYTCDDTSIDTQLCTLNEKQELVFNIDFYFKKFHMDLTPLQCVLALCIFIFAIRVVGIRRYLGKTYHDSIYGAPNAHKYKHIKLATPRAEPQSVRSNGSDRSTTARSDDGEIRQPQCDMDGIEMALLRMGVPRPAL